MASKFGGVPVMAEPAAQGYGKRQDGTEKGAGYFGELKRPDGDFSTEISIGVDYGSGEKEIPTLVPTLTNEEKTYLLNDGKPTKAIIDKAVQHARMRESKGLSPFAGPEDYQPAAPVVKASKFGGVPVSAPSAPIEQKEETGILSRIGEMITGSDRETRATRELPELEGILAGEDIPAAQAAAIFAAIPTTTNPQEIADMLRGASKNIGISQDEKGNLIATNNRTGAQSVINKPGFSGLDALQAGALAAAFAPAGRGATAVGGGIARQAATLGAGSALTQAAIEGAQAAAGGEFNADEVAMAGATGAAVPAIAGAVGAGVDAARRGVQAVRAAPGGQAPIVQAAERANIPLMTTDVVQPDTFIGKSAQTLGERIPLAGTGGLRATQQDARQAAVKALGDEYPVPKPSAIIDSLKAQKSRIKQAAGRRYDELVPKVDGLGAIQYTKTQKAIDDALAELSKPGVVSSKEAIQELQQFSDTLKSAPQTYSSLKENRTALRDVVSSYDAQGRSQLPTRAKSLLNRVYGSLTSDMDDAARSALSPRDFGRLKEANAIYASEAERLTKTRLKNVLDKGDLTPEVAENLLFSAKRSEVKNLYDSLDSSGRDAVRASIIQRAIKDADGIDNVSPDKFINAMRRLENQTGVAFKGDQRRQLEGLKQVLAATKRAGQAGVRTATGQELYAPVGAAAAGSLIGDFGTTMAAGATAGALARIYESPAMRNVLIRIGSAPKSDASKQMALKLARDLSAGIQSARAQSTEEK